jgi:hypothetical protein
VIGVGDLGSLLGPARLAQRYVARMHVAAPHGGDARAAGPEQQKERERHLDEERQQDGLNGHDVFGALTA